MPELVRPSARYKESYLEALLEFHAEGRLTDLDPVRLRQLFPVFVQSLLDKTDPAKLRPGVVPETVLWLVEAGAFVGRVSVRHTLSASLAVWGGHIGYEIRPSQRRRGYGTLALQLALPWAKKVGIERALVTCDKGNLGSRKIIEAGGGVLESEVTVEGQPEAKLRFWIEL